MKKFNIHFFILLFIAVMISLSDILIYIFKLKFIPTNIVVGIVLFLITILLKKKEYISFETNFSNTDIIFISFLGIYIVFSIVFPDLLWDTRSYHIYLQENVFVDKINSDFFAARNLNSFLFALGDRINFFFRSILGYRLGTIMSYYLMLILYYQVKRILTMLLPNEKEKKISKLSIIPVIMSVIFAYAGSYYIDNFGLVFLVEIFYIVLFEKEVLKQRIKLYILGLLVGLAIAIKITNVIFLIPLAIYFFIKNIKDIRNIKIYDYLMVITFVFIPFGVYAIYNYIATKNPVFPYYNNVFKSEFFMLKSWKDENFGARNILQFILWPIYIVFNPKRAFDTKFVDLNWAISYIAIISYIIYCIRKKKIQNNELFCLCIITLINIYLWQILLIGYVRYASVLLVLGTIIYICILNNIKNNKNILYKFLLSILVLCSLPSLVYDFGVVIKDTKSLSGFVNEYIINCKMLLKDKKTEKLKIEGVFGAIGDDSLLPTLLSNGNNIYNLEEWVTITNEKTRDMYNEKILNKEIVLPVDEKTIERKKDYLRRNNFEILEQTKMEVSYSFLSPTDELYLLKVIKKENNK